MKQVDTLIKSLLDDLPKKNTPSLKVYILNVSMMERFEKVQSRFNENESKLFKIIDTPVEDMSSLLKSLKSSNRMIESSDTAIERLLKSFK